MIEPSQLEISSAAQGALPTVLIAEDDADLQEILVDCLQSEGEWRIIKANDGAQALDEILARQPDIAVLDYRMPKLNGAEVVASVRRAGLDIPIILVTAAADIALLARRAGVKCYLGKPFMIDDLISLLRNALAGAC